MLNNPVNVYGEDGEDSKYNETTGSNSKEIDNCALIERC